MKLNSEDPTSRLGTLRAPWFGTILVGVVESEGTDTVQYKNELSFVIHVILIWLWGQTFSTPDGDKVVSEHPKFRIREYY